MVEEHTVDLSTRNFLEGGGSTKTGCGLFETKQQAAMTMVTLLFPHGVGEIKLPWHVKSVEPQAKSMTLAMRLGERRDGIKRTLIYATYLTLMIDEEDRKRRLTPQRLDIEARSSLPIYATGRVARRRSNQLHYVRSNFHDLCH